MRGATETGFPRTERPAPGPQAAGSVKTFLVLGLGAYAFGRERRAVRMLGPMRRLRPYFIVPSFTDGTVAALLDQSGLSYRHAPFGYLGRARLRYTLVTVLNLPLLHYRLVRAYYGQRCRGVLLLSDYPLINCPVAILFLKYIAGADIVPYFGDIPSGGRAHRLLGWLIERLCSRGIAVSAAVKGGLVANGVASNKVHVIHNGVDLDRFSAPKRTMFHQRFSWPPGDLIVGFVGRFTDQKGVWDFVRAAETVIMSNRGCRFVMIGKVGDDDQYHDVVRYVESRGLGQHLAFPGWVDNMESAYAGMDIAVMPSRYSEALGNVNLEAMASGIPVIGTRVGGIPEAIVDGETGFLVQPACPQQIADRILTLADDVDLRRKMGNAGRERVRRMFDTETNVLRVESLLCNDNVAR